MACCDSASMRLLKSFLVAAASRSALPSLRCNSAFPFFIPAICWIRSASWLEMFVWLDRILSWIASLQGIGLTGLLSILSSTLLLAFSISCKLIDDHGESKEGLDIDMSISGTCGGSRVGGSFAQNVDQTRHDFQLYDIIDT